MTASLRSAVGAKLLTSAIITGDSGDKMKGPLLQLKSILGITSWTSYYGTVIEDNLLLYKDQSSAKAVFCCYGYSIHSVSREAGKDKKSVFAFKVVIEGDSKELFFAVDSAASCERWIQVLQGCVKRAKAKLSYLPKDSKGIQNLCTQAMLNLNNISEIVPVFDEFDTILEKLMQSNTTMKEASQLVEQFQSTYRSVVHYGEIWTEKLHNKLWSMLEHADTLVKDRPDLVKTAAAVLEHDGRSLEMAEFFTKQALRQLSDKLQESSANELLGPILRCINGFLLNDASFFKERIVPCLPVNIRESLFSYYVIQIRGLVSTRVHKILMSFTEIGIENHEILTFLRWDDNYRAALKQLGFAHDKNSKGDAEKYEFADITDKLRTFYAKQVKALLANIVYTVNNREKSEEISFIEGRPYTYGFNDIYKVTDNQIKVVKENVRCELNLASIYKAIFKSLKRYEKFQLIFLRKHSKELPLERMVLSMES